MKLFQQMLVATAAVGFFAPIAAQASDVINIDGMNDYSRSKKSAKRIDSKTFIRETNNDIAVLKGRVDGLEAQAEVDKSDEHWADMFTAPIDDDV